MTLIALHSLMAASYGHEGMNAPKFTFKVGTYHSKHKTRREEEIDPQRDRNNQVHKKTSKTIDVQEYVPLRTSNLRLRSKIGPPKAQHKAS